MAVPRPKRAALVMLAVLGWFLVGASIAYLSWPASDRLGRPCGSALSPTRDPMPSDDSYLSVCTGLTDRRADIGWSLVSASALVALAATVFVLAARRRQPWQERERQMRRPRITRSRQRRPAH